MRIAIVRPANVGGALGAALSRVGHDVTYGVRDPACAKTRAASPGAETAQIMSRGVAYAISEE